MAKKPQTKGKTTPMTTETTGGKQSLETRLENARKLVAKYEAMLNAEKQINNVQVGDAGVTFKFGRSDKSRNEVGTVVGLSDTPQGRIVAIQTGEGIDVAIRKVRAADIISNPAADERNSAESGEEASADADPLAAE